MKQEAKPLHDALKFFEINSAISQFTKYILSPWGQEGLYRLTTLSCETMWFVSTMKGSYSTDVNLICVAPGNAGVKSLFTADAKSKASSGSSPSKASLAATVRPHKAAGLGSLSPHSSPATSSKPAGKAFLLVKFSICMWQLDIVMSLCIVHGRHLWKFASLQTYCMLQRVQHVQQVKLD